MSDLRDERTETFTRLRDESSAGSPSTSPSRDESSREQAETFAPDPLEGKCISAYRILHKIGSGGMGHVYVAIDTRLNRQVAVKFLLPDRIGDTVSMLRMQQEAKTASALNHPNILTIFEICEFEGCYCIISEYVEGINVRSAMANGGMEPAKALDIAIQVASALVAAHTVKIVHRDLKPSNIMLRKDGYIKLIDFGLAKQMPRGPDETAEVSLTRPGMVVGTIDYMSPEQARGLEVDHRTDLWSLGVILYEMLTKRRPFEGPTEHHILVAICDSSPAALSAGGFLPGPVRRLLQRALSKDLTKRYQSAAEMLSDLEQVRARSSRSISKFSHTALPAKSRRRNWIAWSAAAGLLLLIGISAWRSKAIDRIFSRPDWLTMAPVRQLTFNGSTQEAAISPDGRYLAFAEGDVDGVQTLMLKQVDSAAEDVKIPARRVAYVGLTFSPDSQYLYEAEKDESLVGRLYRVPILGAKPHVPILVDIDGPVSFSSSGDQFSFVRRVPGKGTEHAEGRVEIANRDGTQRRSLISKRDYTVHRFTSWSPQRDTVAVVLENAGAARAPGEKFLDLVSLESEETLVHLPDWRIDGRFFWMRDGRSIVIASANSTQSRDRSQMRQFAVARGQVRAITKDLAGYKSATSTTDGRRMAAVKIESRASVWVANVSDLSKGQSTATESEERPSLAWSGNDHLVINSQRNGFTNLWLLDAGLQSRTGLTNEPFVEEGAATVPGSRSIVFSSNKTSPSHLWRFDPETNELTQLTSGLTFDEQPDIAPDGTWLVYTAWMGNIPYLKRLDLVTRKASQAVPYAARDGKISPDGKTILCETQDPVTKTWAVATVPVDGPANLRFWPQIGPIFKWSADGRAITAVRTDAHETSNIWSYPLNGSPARQLTSFFEQGITAFTWSPSGERLAAIRVSTGADVMLFEREKTR